MRVLYSRQAPDVMIHRSVNTMKSQRPFPPCGGGICTSPFKVQTTKLCTRRPQTQLDPRRRVRGQQQKKQQESLQRSKLHMFLQIYSVTHCLFQQQMAKDAAPQASEPIAKDSVKKILKIDLMPPKKLPKLIMIQVTGVVCSLDWKGSSSWSWKPRTR